MAWSEPELQTRTKQASVLIFSFSKWLADTTSHSQIGSLMLLQIRKTIDFPTANKTNFSKEKLSSPLAQITYL